MVGRLKQDNPCTLLTLLNYYSWSCALLPGPVWGAPHPGAPSHFHREPRVSPGLCLQTAAAGLAQPHLFRWNFISPQAESLLPPPALSLALISGKMSSRSFPPVQKSKVKNFINNQEDIINILMVPDPHFPLLQPLKVPPPPTPPHSPCAQTHSP